MRKIILLLLIAVLSGILASAAAENTPSVSLSVAEDAQNGGLAVCVNLTADQPVDTDTEIFFSDSEGNSYSAIIANGDAQTSVSVETPVVTTRTALAFTLTAGDGYLCGTCDAVTLQPLTQIEFYQSIYVRKVNAECVIAVTLKRNHLLEDGEFALHNQNGETLATLTIKKNTQLERFYFKWTPDESQAGRQDISIWWNGFEVSPEESYLAIYAGDHLVVRNYDVSENFIALSLDCAHQWAYVDDFLEMLDRQDVKVTFFMTGFGAKANPEAVQKMLDHGHELGNHSYWHYHMAGLDNLLTIRSEIRATNDLIEEITGVRPVVFRPPYGDYNKYVSAISRAEGCEVIMWTNDANDWRENSTVESIYKNIIRDAAPGNIILAHILNKDTVEALDMAITYFKEQGYRLGTVSDLAAIYAEETGKENDQ